MEPSVRYRAAVLGCGAIGSFIADEIADAPIRMGLPYGHAPVYRASARTELVAGSDVNPERRAAFARRWNLPLDRVWENYRDLLNSERPDIVSIASPTPCHVEMAEDSIRAGVGTVFLEKPVANDLESAYRLQSLASAHGVAVAVNHTRRGDQLYRRARQLIAGGAIGRLHSMIAQFCGGLMWNGTHAFDTLNYLNGDTPARFIQGHLDEPAGYDPGGSAYLVYENDVRAFVNGTSGNPVLFRIEAMGSEGRIVIGNYDLELWKRQVDNGLASLVRHPFPQVLPAVSPMLFLLEELLDATEHGTAISSNLDTSIAALEQIVGLHRSSSDGGSRVLLPNDDRSFAVPSP